MSTYKQLVNKLTLHYYPTEHYIHRANDDTAHLYRGSETDATAITIRMDKDGDWTIYPNEPIYLGYYPYKNYADIVHHAEDLPPDPYMLRTVTRNGYGMPVFDPQCAHWTNTEPSQVKHLFPDVDIDSLPSNHKVISHGTRLAYAIATYNENSDTWELQSNFREFANGKVTRFYI